MFKRKREEIKMESLLTQLDFLDALRNRHEFWAKDVDSPRIVQTHLEIVDLIVEMRATYNRLLDLYRQQSE